MKSQGLPINFIVLAAVGIFILILVIVFVISGGSSATSALSPQQVRNSCNNACVALTQWGTTVQYFGGWTTDNPDDFCKNYNIAGTGNVNCASSAVGISCIFTLQDGTSVKPECHGTSAWIVRA